MPTPVTRRVSISLSASGGGYDGVTASVSVAVADDEALGLVPSTGSLNVTEEASGRLRGAPEEPAECRRDGDARRRPPRPAAT